MNGTTVSPVISLLKTSGKTIAGQGKQIKGEASNGTPLFNETLSKALSKNGGKSQSQPVGLKQILDMLMSLLKNASMNAKGPKITSKNAGKVIQLLKNAIQLLKSKQKENTHSQTDSLASELALFQFAIVQIQDLETSSPEKGNSGKAQEKLTHLAADLEKAIKKLLVVTGNTSGKQAISAQGKDEKVFVSAKHPQNDGKGTEKGKQKKSSEANVQKQNVVPQQSSKGANFVKGSTSLKEAAMTAFHKINETKDAKQTQANGFHPGPMPKLQQFVLQVKQNNGHPNQQQFVHDFEKLLAKGTFTNVNGKQQLTLQLHPRHLGTLKIQLTRENGQLTATLVASTKEGKNLVLGNLQQLQGAFASQNLNVQKLQVLLPFAQLDSQQQAQDFGNSDGQAKQQQQEADQQEKERQQNEESGFSDWLKQLDPNLGEEVRL